MDRNDHKGHKVADQAYHYGKIRIHHADRAQSDFCQKVVIPLSARRFIPPCKHVDPHWNGYQHNEKSLDFLRASRNDQGKGIAKHQTDKGGEKSQPEGFQDHIQDKYLPGRFGKNSPR